jgi:hypothetical protein
MRLGSLDRLNVGSKRHCAIDARNIYYTLAQKDNRTFRPLILLSIRLRAFLDGLARSPRHSALPFPLSKPLGPKVVCIALTTRRNSLTNGLSSGSVAVSDVSVIDMAPSSYQTLTHGSVGPGSFRIYRNKSACDGIAGDTMAASAGMIAVASRFACSEEPPHATTFSNLRIASSAIARIASCLVG